jgi:predicted nucleotidyltransferase
MGASDVPLPSLNPAGDLPSGIHLCSMRELLEKFATNPERVLIGMRLQRVLSLLSDWDQVARAIVFGSFVSDKAAPNDVDLFLVMEDTFDLSQIHGQARLLFDHAVAQAHFGASVFWVRRMSCFPSEAEMVLGWGMKRDGSARGIVELVKESP